MESQGSMVNSVAIVFAVISFIAVVLRLWARAFIVRSVGNDDYLICVGALLSWSFIACTIASVKHGLGSHYEEVIERGPDNLIAYSQIVWLSSIFYNACLGFIKISVLALYTRLGDKVLRKTAFFMMVVVGCQAGGNVLACIFQCTPVSAAYDIRIQPSEKKCVDINAFYLANAAVNIFTDILTYTLPIPLVTRLRVPRRQKISLAIILGLGLFACISSIIRITYIPPMLTSTDPTWVIANAMYWSVIETNIGILAASIPSYKAIAKKYAPRLLGSTGISSNKLSGFKQRPIELRGNSVPGTGAPKSTFETNIKNGLGDNSSEEVLVMPSGQIGVKTDIVFRYEHNLEDGHNHGGRI
ncbi:integral membrane protein [Fusarium langsethiae]|uniref:Integral membrane protein n=1 Tax=Fusarium langsethiae TaxID=179993 RepID=A0A0M9ENL4_FUSLA|nr:integral membrane protein [Fusarium langsethiae]